MTDDIDYSQFIRQGSVPFGWTPPGPALPRWITARNLSPRTFEGRLYAYGSPAEAVEDRRQETPVAYRPTRLEQAQALLRDMMPDLSALQTRSRPHRMTGRLASDLGYYDVVPNTGIYDAARNGN